MSPKNPPNNSPKRLIRNSLETARKDALLQKNGLNSQNNASQKDRNENKIGKSV